MENLLFIERQQDTDITKHLESLKTRLGFARFKLCNGWENNTLMDIESFWKERQRQLVDELPVPKLSQRDILDNRTLHPHYHYYQFIIGARVQLSENGWHHQQRYSHPSHGKKKRAKSKTSASPQTQYINPSIFPSSFKAHQFFDDDDNYPSIYPKDRKRKRNMTRAHPSTSAGSSISHPNLQSNRVHHIQHRKTRNSLDCLSYAVSMKEKKQHNQLGIDNSSFQQDSESGSDTTHQGSDDSDQHHTNLHIPFFKTPTSPVTAAAETMMMFGHHHS
ncbi:hypothetical protein BCR42DRAFT_357603 [Absidia repens]|uniref:Uncharacterized protein n=1 Tax=Absidia repens TaxID=90262 RepID=A0A1X2I747_9FUNG|nr:hypothetical protein BCR42DRAFT_357603 [Absidia repens]